MPVRARKISVRLFAYQREREFRCFELSARAASWRELELERRLRAIEAGLTA